jgi:hypothetical protein
LRYTATVLQKKRGTGLESRFQKAQQPHHINVIAAFSWIHAAQHGTLLRQRRVGAPERVRRFLLPVFQPHTVCHHRLESMATGFQSVQKEPNNG